jgi:spore coat protein A
MKLNRRQVLQVAAAGSVVALLNARPTAVMAAPPVLKKWVDALAIPPVITGHDIEMSMVRTTHTFRTGLPASPALAYELVPGTGTVVDPGTPSAKGYLGPTIVATTGQQLNVKMTNNIGGHPLPIDMTIHGTQEGDQASPRVSTHLHGGNTKPAHDGGPEDDFLTDHTYVFDNTQDAAGIWYHDHAIGITRVNVYAGLAGGYLIRDTPQTGIDTGGPDSPLPTGKYEIPLIIQDKLFDLATGALVYDGGQWVPEFFGDTPVVNGTAFPFLSVDKGVYRFRVYNGSQARFYRSGLKVKATGAALPFFQIGSDGGLFNLPVPLTQLVLGPGERADLLVDFRGLPTGALVEMGNNAPTPFPNGPRNFHQGGAPLPQIIQFRVSKAQGFNPAPPIAGMNLRPVTPITRLESTPQFAGAKVRTHSLVEVMGEVMGPAGPVMAPVMALLNNRALHDPAYKGEVIAPQTLEVWEFVNTTVDSHPIHLHLVQFQVVNRQPVDTVAYLAASGYDVNQDGMIMEPEVGKGTYPAPSPTPYLIGAAVQPPAANEMGWKDTVVAPPGMVTRIAVPFGEKSLPIPGTDPVQYTPIAARKVYQPDTTPNPDTGESPENDYVWHCHILEHEEKDMMQYYRIAGPGADPV